MIQSRKRMLFAGLLMLAPVLTACERVDQISSIETPEVNVAAKRKLAKVIEAWVTASGWDMDVATPGKDVTLNVGDYRLYVPKGAVNKKTRFFMIVNPGTTVAVTLKAYDANTLQEVKTFRKELFLTLPYSAIDPSAIGNESKLVVANVSEDGANSILELADTNVDNNAKTVTGKITHFSIWALAKEIIVGID